MNLRCIALIAMLSSLLVLPGCMWATVLVVAIIASENSKDDGGGEPFSADFSVELLDTASPEAKAREGVIPFKVAIGKPSRGGEDDLTFSFRGSDQVEHPLKTAPRILLPDQGPATPRWFIQKDEDDSRIILWDTRDEGIISSPVTSLLVRWGPFTASSPSIFVDNTPIPEIEIAGPVRNETSGDGEEAPYSSVFTVPLLLRWKGPFDSEDPTAGLVTLEATLNIQDSASGSRGHAKLPAEVIRPQVPPVDSEVFPCEFRWRSQEQIPDDSASVFLEIAPRQVKLGKAVVTQSFEVENRAPRPSSPSRLTVPNDRNFTLSVNGSGFCGHGVEIALRKPASVDTVFFPASPPVGAGSPAEGSPNTVSALIDIGEADFQGYRGALDIVVRNPNGRRGAIPAALSMGPSDVQYSGPYHFLIGEPCGVAVGNFLPDPGDSPQMDVAVIFKDQPLVSLFEGDGCGNLAKGPIVDLGEETAAALAIEALPSRGGGPQRFLVATPSALFDIGWDEGPGAFLPIPLGPESGSADDDDIRDIALGDFDGDSIQDAAVSSRDESLVRIFLRSSEGGWKLGKEIPLDSPVALAAANFDKEGASDLAVATGEGGSRLLFLLEPFSGGDSPPVAFTIGEGIVRMESRDDLNFDLNACPDLLILRKDGGSKILVDKPEGSPGIQVTRHPRGQHFVTRPIDLALLHLPGEEEQPPENRYWDFVSIDSAMNKVVFSYSDDADPREYMDTSIYPVPGSGRAVAVGDLDGDGQADVAAVTSGPSVLLTLLAKLPREGVMQHPFHHPFTIESGEDPLPPSEVMGMGCGHAAAGDNDPFIAAANRVNDEVIVFYLNPISGAMVGEERYKDDVGSRIRSILVTDLDRDGLDDIVIDPEDQAQVLFLRNQGNGASPRFALAPENGGILVDLNVEMKVNPKLSPLTKKPKGRILEKASMDPDPHPDILLPLTSMLKEDFICVLLNPGNPDPASRQVHFYRTHDDPRHAAAANLNGDKAADLIVACEGQQGVNGIHLLFGDPARPGILFDSETPPETPGFIPPIILEPYPIPPGSGASEVEVVGSENSPDAIAGIPFSGWPKARWIVASTNGRVAVYRNNTVNPLDPKFDSPVEIFSGGDPEDFLVWDLDGDLDLDIAALDESGGKMAILEGSEEQGSPSWTLLEPLYTVGDPQKVIPLSLGGELWLAAANRAFQQVDLFKRSGENKLRFLRRPSMSLEEKETDGSTGGLSVRQGDWGCAAAALCEEGDRREAKAAVDLLDIPNAISMQDLVDIGSRSPESQIQKFRLLIDPAFKPDGVLLGEFCSGTGIPDLLVHEESGKVACYCRRGVEEPPFSDAERIEMPWSLPTLADWETVQGPGSRILVLAAMDTEARLLAVDPEGQWASPWNSREASGPIRRIIQGQIRQYTWNSMAYGRIRRIAHGRIRPDTGSLDGLYAAILEDQRLTVEVLGKGGETSASFKIIGAEEPGGQSAGKLGCLGAGDLNEDGLDDLAVVDGIKSHLSVFLAASGVNGFDPPRLFSFPGPVEPVDIAFLDANGDSVADVCFAEKLGKVFLFLGTRDGSLDPPLILYAGPGVEACSAADLDGDRRDEILVSVSSLGLIVLTPSE